MKLMISAILILISCFAHAIDFNYHSDNTQFYLLIKQIESQKTLPRLDTAKGKAILSKFTDPKLIGNFSNDKLDEQLQITNYINYIVEMYLIFSPNKSNQLTSQDLTNNLKKFQAEIILLSNFNIKYFAAISQQVNQFYKELPEAEKGGVIKYSTKMIQAEMLKYYYGGFKWMELPDCLTEQSKLNIITTLEQSAENYANVITEQQKLQIIEKAETLITQQPAFEAQLSHIIEVMKKSKCEELCQIANKKIKQPEKIEENN
ncbi:hypothetical protein GA0061081_11046 [Gilliamella bombicola]|uniref:Uncharacterized protein n=1 Tax=Gilliamella bombicola TaxID=1798182 RepID=A0A1C4CQP4_9GAMM|nr:MULTISPECIES: hypothetical protein [Gilliamella]NUF26815.1 hypothetical protein [Gilliamella sp. ESL0254]SCC21447.1 hypothetical protein GA0061081_11046 [Gilliamella bombicola]